MIGKTLGQYRIVKQLGAGGMGVVYRAHDERLDRDVALKVLPASALEDEAARKRFRKEALALSKLNHPNIATIFDFNTLNGVDFLVMELVEGESLAQKVEGRALAEKEVAALGGQIAEALEEAHEQGVVHRDLKLANIVVTPKGRVKVLDFGLAKLLRPAGQTDLTASLTATPAAAGTLPYMAPEQLQGEAVDARSDIYSLGAVLYEMATGRRAFREELSTRLIDAILHRPPVAPRAVQERVSPELERIILKCLEKEPASRYQSAKDAAVDLRRIAAETLAPPSAAIPRSARWPVGLWAGALGVLAAGVLMVVIFSRWRTPLVPASGTARIRSLVVLPLENLSGDPEQQFFADGMTEELTTELAQVSALRVISRTSAMRYRGTKKPLADIARELNVDAVVEGSVERGGSRVRITAQLIEASTDTHLWAKSFERDLRDVLAIQSEVASAIVHEIQVKLTPEESNRIAASRPINPAAHEAYLRGIYSFQEGRNQTEERQYVTSFTKSIEQFQEAIRLDPNYAQAYAGLARAYHWLAGVRGIELAVKSRQAAEKALALDNNLAEAYGALGYVALTYEWDFPRAEQELRRAIDLNPNYEEAHHGYGLYLLTVGRAAEAVSELSRSRELDPSNLAVQESLGIACTCAGQYDRAIGIFQSLLAIRPNAADFHRELADAFIEKGEVAQGLEAARRAVQIEPENPFNLVTEVWAEAASGNRAAALKTRGDLEGLARKKPTSRVALAEAHAALGENNRAFELLQDAIARHEMHDVGLKCDGVLRTLRDDPRFAALLRRMNLPQ